MTLDLLTLSHYQREHLPLIRSTLADVYAEVYSGDAADAFHSVRRFEDRLSSHASGSSWAYVVGDIEGEPVGFATDGSTASGSGARSSTRSIPPYGPMAKKALSASARSWSVVRGEGRASPEESTTSSWADAPNDAHPCWWTASTPKYGHSTRAGATGRPARCSPSMTHPGTTPWFSICTEPCPARRGSDGLPLAG